MTDSHDPDATGVPRPPHPEHRREPLPQAHPKPGKEDPGAPARIQALLEAPSYRRADKDTDFLERDEVRGLRLQLDYLKPELLMQQEQVGHTIVVFGSTRIVEPAAAEERVNSLEKRLQEHPDDRQLQRQRSIQQYDAGRIIVGELCVENTRK